MKLFFLFTALIISYNIDESTKHNLDIEDKRMITHLRKEGWKAHHPNIYFPEDVKNPEHSSPVHEKNRKFSIEDLRMVNHLRSQGWTIT